MAEALREDDRPLYVVLGASLTQLASAHLLEPRIAERLTAVWIGDSPLVLLTALQSAYEPDPSSSFYDTVPAPEIGDDGWYLPRPDGRPIRVYTRIDNRLMLEDLYAKLALHAGR